MQTLGETAHRAVRAAWRDTELQKVKQGFLALLRLVQSGPVTEKQVPLSLGQRS